MKIIKAVSIKDLQQHEGACYSTVPLGSLEMGAINEFKVYKATLDADDIERIFLLNCGFVPCTRRETGKLKDIEWKKLSAASNDRVNSFLEPPVQDRKNRFDLRFAPRLSLVLVCANKAFGPWAIIDGNHRAIAQYLAHGNLREVPAYVCVHSQINEWEYIPELARSMHLQSEVRTMHQILNLCSRVRQHPKQQQRLVSACTDFTQWDDLLHSAEEQGMGPLLHKHIAAIEVDLPGAFLRGLRFLCLRHQQANALLMQCLHGMLELLAAEGIDCLVLKGAALCNVLYPNIGMRPMRDIDLLLAREDVDHAHAFLLKNGFYTSTTVMPDDHYHLAPLYQSIGGMQVCVELHLDLFPDCPPYYRPLPFADLYQNARSFDVNGVTGYTLATEEMLWHLYQHGFHAPLTYEPFKLISAADIVSLVEEKVEEIDWGKVESIYPELFNALPVFHYLTPWNEKALEKISIKGTIVSSGIGEPFTGWPRLRLSQQKERGFLEILRHTFLPGRWWLMVYYAPTGKLSYLWCKFFRHPKHLFWWLKLYGSIFLEVNLPYEENGRKGSVLPIVKHLKQLSTAMYRKFR